MKVYVSLKTADVRDGVRRHPCRTAVQSGLAARLLTDGVVDADNYYWTTDSPDDTRNPRADGTMYPYSVIPLFTDP
jgi:sugar lactone lactonase YvrE